jgi:hypothetical protein
MLAAKADQIGLQKLSVDLHERICTYLSTKESVAFFSSSKWLMTGLNSDSFWQHCLFRDWRVKTPDDHCSFKATWAARLESFGKRALPAYARVHDCISRLKAAFVAAGLPLEELQLLPGSTRSQLEAVEVELPMPLNPVLYSVYLNLGGQAPVAKASPLFGGVLYYNNLHMNKMMSLDEVSPTHHTLLELGFREELWPFTTTSDGCMTFVDLKTGGVLSMTANKRSALAAAPLAPTPAVGAAAGIASPDEWCIIRYIDEYSRRLESGVYCAQDSPDDFPDGVFKVSKVS